MLLLKLEKLKIKVFAFWPKKDSDCKVFARCPSGFAIQDWTFLLDEIWQRTRGQEAAGITHNVATIQIVTQNLIVCAALNATTPHRSCVAFKVHENKWESKKERECQTWLSIVPPASGALEAMALLLCCQQWNHSEEKKKRNVKKHRSLCFFHIPVVQSGLSAAERSLQLTCHKVLQLIS